MTENLLGTCPAGQTVAAGGAGTQLVPLLSATRPALQVQRGLYGTVVGDGEKLNMPLELAGQASDKQTPATVRVGMLRGQSLIKKPLLFIAQFEEQDCPTIQALAQNCSVALPLASGLLANCAAAAGLQRELAPQLNSQVG